MSALFSVWRSELRNVLRSKWIYSYSFIIALLVGGFFYLVDDARKAELGLVGILLPLVPLVSILFTTTYWYLSDRFTELLLSQPVSRAELFWSRVSALIGSLAVSSCVGIVFPAYVWGASLSDISWIFAATLGVGAIFCIFGAVIATAVSDRMWGIGLGFFIWIYCVALHDAIVLLILYWFRDYSLQRVSVILCAINPLSLSRVLLLMKFDAPLLLGHSGALIRRGVETGVGYWIGMGTLALWLLVPALAAYRLFRRRDF